MPKNSLVRVRNVDGLHDKNVTYKVLKGESDCLMLDYITLLSQDIEPRIKKNNYYKKTHSTMTVLDE